MDTLREKCPWDKKQTFESLRYLTIEETYELSDAIVEKNTADICKELGDLMLHLVFYTKIASEQGFFDITDVLSGLIDKLIRRHPHIFGEATVRDAKEVRANWEVIKLQEGNRSVLGGVPASLPAMVKAYRIQEKVAGVGFDWDNIQQVYAKIKEEIKEFKLELQTNTANKENEFGDILFALINYARWLNINPEDALEKTNKKFIRRFQDMEQQAREQEKTLNEFSLNELENMWTKAKQKEQTNSMNEK
jgi:XTP/dITP diphosphohydrolase